MRVFRGCIMLVFLVKIVGSLLINNDFIDSNFLIVQDNLLIFDLFGIECNLPHKYTFLPFKWINRSFLENAHIWKEKGKIFYWLIKWMLLIRIENWVNSILLLSGCFGTASSQSSSIRLWNSSVNNNINWSVPSLFFSIFLIFPFQFIISHFFLSPSMNECTFFLPVIATLITSNEC